MAIGSKNETLTTKQKLFCICLMLTRHKIHNLTNVYLLPNCNLDYKSFVFTELVCPSTYNDQNQWMFF